MRHRLNDLAATALIAATLAILPLPAHAFEIFGFRIFGSDEPEEADVIGDPQAYEVTFETGEAEREVARAAQGASQLWGERGEPASGAAGLISRAKSDYRRILGALYAEGHYGGVISIRIDGREAADLPADTVLPPTAMVSVTVDVGPQFQFADTRIANRAPPPTVRDDEVDLPEEEGFAAGEVARSAAILRAERLATEAWREQGFAKAEIADRQVTADHRDRTVDAALTVEPGQRASYGEVTVAGTERMNPAFVRRQTGLPLGQEYDPDDLEKARDRLARLDVFESLVVREADEIARNGLLPISVDVQERPLRRIGIGGTFSTVEGLGIETFWLHRNLFGEAQRLRLDASVGGLGTSLDYEEFDFNVGATYTQPGTFTPDTDLVASLFGTREVLDAYTETSVTGRLGVTHIFSDILTGEIFAEAKYGEFEDDIGEREFTTFGVPGKLTLDTRDNNTNATEGYFIEVAAEPFYEFEFGNPAAKGTIEGRAYYGLDADDRFVLAGRLKIGSLAGPDVVEIPPDKLFFSGGGGSTRGYAYRGIGIEGPGGALIGGKSLLEASAEVRAGITESIGLVGFADVGYVGEESFPSFSEDLKIGVGLGLRYNTGLGPIRLDAAVPLDPGPDDPDFAFYVGIGQAF